MSDNVKLPKEVEQALALAPTSDRLAWAWYKSANERLENRAVAAEYRARAAEARVRELEVTVAFFASVIRSGEGWSETCQQHLDAAHQAGEVDRG